jgi:predicted GNAT family acetyltransferase
MTDARDEWRSTWAGAGANPTFRVRPPDEEDQGFITSTWLKSMRKAREYRRWSRHRFHDRMGQLVDRVLDHPGTRALAAVDLRDDWTLRGWLIYTPVNNRTVAVHYGYVPLRERGKGYARALAKEAGIGGEKRILYTCHSPVARSLATRYKATYVSLEEFLR